MKISVVMTTYNGGKYISKQLASIINQTVRPFEIIICDDRSTDNTFHILSEFDYVGIRHSIYQNDRNLGYIKNFRKAMSLATGDVILLCDQDDVWNEYKIEYFNNLFEKYDNVLCANSGFYMIDQDDKIIQNNEAIDTVDTMLKNKIEKIGIDELVKKNISPGCTMAIRSEIVKFYLNTSEDIIPHDYTLNLIAAYKDGCYITREKLVYYRIHSENTIGNSLSASKGHNREKRNRNIQKSEILYKEIKQFLHSELGIINTSFDSYIDRRILFSQRRNAFVLKKQFSHLFYLIKEAELYTSKRALLMDILSFFYLDRIVEKILHVE